MAKNSTISLLLSRSLAHTVTEREEQALYFTDRKIDLIVFYRISTRLANLDGYRQEIQVSEVGKVQDVNKEPFYPPTQWGVVRTGANREANAPFKGGNRRLAPRLLLRRNAVPELPEIWIFM